MSRTEDKYINIKQLISRNYVCASEKVSKMRSATFKLAYS